MNAMDSKDKIHNITVVLEIKNNVFEGLAVENTVNNKVIPLSIDTIFLPRANYKSQHYMHY